VPQRERRMIDSFKTRRPLGNPDDLSSTNRTTAKEDFTRDATSPMSWPPPKLGNPTALASEQRRRFVLATTGGTSRRRLPDDLT